MEQLLVGIPAAAKAIGASRSVVYELIKDGRVEAVKVGRRRMIVVASIVDYVTSLRKKPA